MSALSHLLKIGEESNAMTFQQIATTAILFAAAGAVSGPALADYPCSSSVGAVTIDDNVFVAGNCSLVGTVVKGNVLMASSGSLLVTNNARIDGNIQADGGESVVVTGGTTVNGDIQLENLYGGESEVTNSTVLGSLQLTANQVPLAAANTVIDGDLQAFSNYGGLTIRGNWIDGNLQCKSNDPPPVGGNNLVSGSKEDQCAALGQNAGGGGSGSAVVSQGALEIPQPGSAQSGIGVISGWRCDASIIEMQIDGGRLVPLAYGTERRDTEGVCGDSDNGFVFLINYSGLGAGQHTVALLADGAVFGSADFTVTTLGEEFARGLEKFVTVSDFPYAGDTAVLRWDEPSQSFVLHSLEGQAAVSDDD
jgi:hypothetical protein